MTDVQDKLDHERWFLDRESDSVPGFLTDASAAAIAVLLRFQLERDIVGSLAEIGTYKGKTFVGMLKASRDGEKIVGFDLFPPEVTEGFQQALATIDPVLRDRAVAIRRDTRQLGVAEWMATLGSPARFVHIDGGHNRDAFLADLRLATSFLHASGLVVIDDFLHDWYPDLTEAIIDGLKASVDIVPIALMPRTGPAQNGGSKLVCATPASADVYRNLLATAFQAMRPGTRLLAGSQVVTFQGFA